MSVRSWWTHSLFSNLPHFSHERLELLALKLDDLLRVVLRVSAQLLDFGLNLTASATTWTCKLLCTLVGCPHGPSNELSMKSLNSDLLADTSPPFTLHSRRS